MSKTTTVTIQIDNTDDKLTQQEWSNFVTSLVDYMHNFNHSVHFTGGSSPENPWQNYCVVATVDEGSIPHLKSTLHGLAVHFNQNSIALTMGPTMFVEGVK